MAVTVRFDSLRLEKITGSARVIFANVLQESENTMNRSLQTQSLLANYAA